MAPREGEPQLRGHSQEVRAGRPDSQAEPSLKEEEGRGGGCVYLCHGCLLGCLSLSLLVQLDKITPFLSSPRPSLPRPRLCSD